MILRRTVEIFKRFTLCELATKVELMAALRSAYSVCHERGGNLWRSRRNSRWPFRHRLMNGDDMEKNTHLAWLRIAHALIASAPSDDCVKELVASMPDRATFAERTGCRRELFLPEFAELAGAAEIRFLDACVSSRTMMVDSSSRR